MNRVVSAIVFILLLTSMLVLASFVHLANAEYGTIYIRADGSIDPPTAPMSTIDNVTYMLTGNITSLLNGIEVQRDNIVLDGSDFTVEGGYSSSGIQLWESTNVTIKNTNIENSLYGILLYYSCGNDISGNNITNNDCGISLRVSSNNSIHENNLTNNNPGIDLGDCDNNNVSGNTFINDGLYVWNSFSNIVENNTVNGRPLVYLEGVADHSVEDAGQVILVRCDRIRVEGLSLSRTCVGVHLYRTNNSIVFGNDIADSFDIEVDYSSNNNVSGNTITNGGIFLGYSSNNSVVRNTITNSDYNGVRLVYSFNNSISENNITNNSICGIRLAFSDSNSIGGNIITDNSECGIWLNSCSNNTVCHNNLVNNTAQVKDLTPGYPNFWDNGCEGNYWNNYNGSDLDNDGVGDTILPWEGKDNYPLMNVYWNPCDINHDLKVDFKDIGPSAKAFGTVPGDAWWNPHADITGPDEFPDWKVDMRDISLIAKHFGERYL